MQRKAERDNPNARERPAVGGIQDGRRARDSAEHRAFRHRTRYERAQRDGTAEGTGVPAEEDDAREVRRQRIFLVVRLGGEENHSRASPSRDEGKRRRHADRGSEVGKSPEWVAQR